MMGPVTGLPVGGLGETLETALTQHAVQKDAAKLSVFIASIKGRFDELGSMSPTVAARCLTQIKQIPMSGLTPEDSATWNTLQGRLLSREGSSSSSPTPAGIQLLSAEAAPARCRVVSVPKSMGTWSTQEETTWLLTNTVGADRLIKLVAFFHKIPMSEKRIMAMTIIAHCLGNRADRDLVEKFTAFADGEGVEMPPELRPGSEHFKTRREWERIAELFGFEKNPGAWKRGLWNFLDALHHSGLFNAKSISRDERLPFIEKMLSIIPDQHWLELNNALDRFYSVHTHARPRSQLEAIEKFSTVLNSESFIGEPAERYVQHLVDRAEDIILSGSPSQWENFTAIWKLRPGESASEYRAFVSELSKQLSEGLRSLRLRCPGIDANPRFKWCLDSIENFRVWLVKP